MKKRILGSLFLSISIILLVIFLLIWNGVILLNNPNRISYPIRGVDVSSYQGAIDWKTLSSQDISFAFIKATEGSNYVDPNFNDNYAGALETDLRVGAYHFFSFDSLGETQAENFISVVKSTDNMLPPVVDFEFYGDKESNLPEVNSTREQLDILLNLIEEHYGIKPIIYATEKSYDLYLSCQYQDYDIWIRNVITYPKLSDNRKWIFWQYTNREHLDGYNGVEKFIDMNVFNGSKEEFDNYAMQIK